MGTKLLPQLYYTKYYLLLGESIRYILLTQFKINNKVGGSSNIWSALSDIFKIISNMVG